MEKKEKVALFFLVIGAFTLRLTLISLDPFLHSWDERFHALVAKNMMDYPFKPMLRANPVLPYDYKVWCCNHIWVHKQPLFLWQMALSMKLFGVHEVALRLPSAIMGGLSVYFIFGIVFYWTKKTPIAYIAAFLFSMCHFQLEMTSGRYALEHNDIAFAFYLTGSIWAFCRYIKKKNIMWAVVIGLFVGDAILNKWLTGLLIFGGWGLYILLDKVERCKIKSYLHGIYSLIVALMVFMPWQIYIMYAFPLESAWEYAFNRKHIFEPLDNHYGSIFYHIDNISTLYGITVVWALIVGVYIAIKNYRNKLTIVFLAIIGVIYFFFSVVATKMPAFTFPVSSLMYGLIAIGLYHTVAYITGLFNLKKRHLLLGSITFILGLFVLNPVNIATYRSIKNTDRNNHIHNTRIFKSLPKSIAGEYIIFNCKSFEDIELMFYQDCIAYHWYPPEKQWNALIKKGYSMAAFKNHTNQSLLSYIAEDSRIKILKESLR